MTKHFSADTWRSHFYIICRACSHCPCSHKQQAANGHWIHNPGANLKLHGQRIQHLFEFLNGTGASSLAGHFFYSQSARMSTIHMLVHICRLMLNLTFAAGVLLWHRREFDGCSCCKRVLGPGLAAVQECLGWWCCRRGLLARAILSPGKPQLDRMLQGEHAIATQPCSIPHD